jgi:hypothetical protein
MALYYPPIKPNAPIFSYQNFALPNTPISPGQGGSSVTEEWLATHYLQFPNAQGVENFGFQELQLTSTNAGESASLYINPNAGQDVVLETSQIDGSLTITTITDEISISPSIGITFNDGTIQNTAYDDTNAVQNNQDNTFLAPYTQTFSGPVNLNGTTTLGSNLNCNGWSLNNINTLNIGNSITNFSTINQNGIQTSIFNNAPYTGGTSNIAFSLLNNMIGLLIM